MKTRCPSCGATFSLDVLVGHEGTREALQVAFKISGALGAALIRYLALFRPETRELTLDRVAKLLGELLPDLQAQKIMRAGKSYEAPTEAWIWAIEQTISARDAGRLATPLKTHGYLYEVITNWRPAAQVVPLTGKGDDGKPRSSTAAAMASLEERIRGS